MTRDFQHRQAVFAAHIRNPEGVPLPEGIEERRMAIYRDLFFNNLSSFLASAFPVCHRLLGELRWKALMRQFMVAHRCETPYFLEISQEFLRFLMEGGAGDVADMPYLLELAHYEWVELALDTLDQSLPEADEPGASLDGVPVISPLAWNLRYQFPVHRIGTSFQPQGPEPVCLVVCRGRDESVQFSEISMNASQLLALMQEKAPQGWTIRACLDALAASDAPADPDIWLEQATAVLEFFCERDILLGTCPA